MAALDGVEVRASCAPIVLPCADGGIKTSQLNLLRAKYSGMTISFRPIRKGRIDVEAGQDATYKELVLHGDPDMFKACLNECLQVIKDNGKEGAAMEKGARQQLLQQQKVQKQNRKRQRTEEHKAAFEKGMVQGDKQGMQHLYQQRGAALVNELIVPDYLPSVQASSLKLALPKKMPAKLAMAKKTEPVEPAPEKVATNHMSDPVKVKLAHTLPAQEATEDPSTLNGEDPF